VHCRFNISGHANITLIFYIPLWKYTIRISFE
jgi:hypothetical protein